jgi:primosomal protein N' (replication factor Y)
LSGIKYIKVILPLALPKSYTFGVPEDMEGTIDFGIRVEVPLRNKLYAGLVVEMHGQDYEPEFATKSILSVLDEEAVITQKQYELWQWIAEYYLCTIGEVMRVALPSGLKLSSETIVALESGVQWEHLSLSDDEFMVVEALEIQEELSIDTIKDILDKKTVYPVIKKLLDKRLIWTREELQESYKPRMISFVKLTETYRNSDTNWEEVLESLKRSKHQTNAVLSLIQLHKQFEHVPKKEVYEMAGITSSVLNALSKKGIVELYEREVSRLEPFEGETELLPPLSDIQKTTVGEIESGFKESHHALLHGVTGSGKTRIYQEFIQRTMDEGGQVLYLLPEIGLTSQIVHRMSKVFGDKVLVFHSKMGIHKRVEIWNATRQGNPLVIGARSALFLPFTKLKLIIVDEEHDASFKQQSPNPRYSARDVASYMAGKWGAKIIFGSASPSLESYYNAIQKKYTYISLNQRHGEVQLPEIEVVNMAEKSNQLPNSRFYSVRLITQIHQVLNDDDQVLLFQNRRGYSPTLICNACGWHSGCKNCDISMTYHKAFNEMRCHYCSAKAAVPKACPQCGSASIFDLGLGTEKVEDELSRLMPEAKIARMDLDTAGTQNAIDKILLDFEMGQIDVLIGTQMITKGLDFDRIGLVGILDADRLIQFPDFRANERAFQLMLQVGGRAGRRKKQGRVIIQTTLVGHPLIQDVLKHDYYAFVTRELGERQQFHYPPFTRLIGIHLQHKDPKLVYKTARYLAAQLRTSLGKRVLGPAVPGIARIRGQYRQHILIKMEKSADTVYQIKAMIKASVAELSSNREYSPVRIILDVDPF